MVVRTLQLNALLDVAVNLSRANVQKVACVCVFF